MRTSGSTDYNLTSRQIVEAAFRKLGVLSDGETMSASKLSNGLQALNTMVAHWQNRRLGLHLTKEFTLFPVSGAQSYLFGANGANATLEYMETALAADVAADAVGFTVDTLSVANAVCRMQNSADVDSTTKALRINGTCANGGSAILPFPRLVTVTVDADESERYFTITGTDNNGKVISADIAGPSAAGWARSGTTQFRTITSVVVGAIAEGGSTTLSGNVTVGYYGICAGDYIGVVLDDNTIYWDYIHTDITDNSTDTVAVTPTSPITGAASDGNTVYIYKTKVGKPIEILSARYRTSSTNERELTILDSVDDYRQIVNKASSGEPTQAVYDPQLNNGVFYIWPVPTDERKLIKCVAKMRIDDIDSQAESVEFPREWNSALIYNLAVDLMEEYPAANRNDQLTIAKAGKYLTEAISFGANTGSIYIIPEQR